MKININSAVRLKWTRFISTLGLSQRYSVVPTQTLFKYLKVDKVNWFHKGIGWSEHCERSNWVKWKRSFDLKKYGLGSLSMSPPFPNSTKDLSLRVAIVYLVMCSAYTPTLPVWVLVHFGISLSCCFPWLWPKVLKWTLDKVNTFFWSQRVPFKRTALYFH